jgi:hypothetical protein
MPEVTPPPEQMVVIPETLRRQLEDFRRHLWKIKILEALIAGLIGLLVSFLLVYGLDRVWQTPGVVRLLILLVGTSLFAVFAPYWLHRWVWRHRREAELARLISRRYPGLGDRLLGVIELQGQHEDAASLSPRLRAAAMEAVAVEAGRRKLDDALPTPRHRKWALAALVLAGGAAAAFALTPRAGLNALQRWLMPLSDTERYTFTKLDNPPVFMPVPFGEAFDVEIRLAKDSEQRPGSAKARYGVQPEVTAIRELDTFVFSFPGQQVTGQVSFQIGDARHVLRVEPTLRPVAESAEALVRPPAYLQIPEKTVDLGSGVLSAVEGSEVRITLNTNRPLAKATFGPTRGVRSAESFEEGTSRAVPEESHTSMGGDLSLVGKRATTSELTVGRQPFEIPFEWVDELGLAGTSGYRLRIDGVPDAPPSAYLQGIDRQRVMLPEETVDFEVFTEDDFGVKVAGIEWAGEFTRPTDEVPSKGEMRVVDGGPEERRVSGDVAFSPAAFGIAPQKIVLRGYVEDYFPDRGRIYSEPVVIYVLTRDEHAQLLKSQLDRAITGLEDLARKELNQYEENQRLDRLSGEELQTEENRKRIDAQEQAEAENTRRMEELTEQMEQLLKDAARNGEIDKETLQKMAEALKSMQELSSEDMPEVEQKLADAQSPSSTPEQTDQDMAQATEQQKEVVEKMQEMLERANDANRRFEAGTFVNRLKKAASEEKGIAGALIDAQSEIGGLRSAELDPSHQRGLNEATRQQADTASDIRWIQEDLGHYFSRTEEALFREILDEMRASNIDIELEDIRSRLQTNHIFVATDSAMKWAEKLNEWASKLEGAMEESGSSSGGGEGGQPNLEDEDFEFMLRVMKMIQQQQDLRARTRALEQLKRSVQSADANPIPSE